jgi:hypothetical protein
VGIQLRTITFKLIINIMPWNYQQKTDKQLKDWFNDKVRTKRSGFEDLTDFRAWYDKKIKACFYCGLTEAESQEIVHNGLLVSKRFPLGGNTDRGVNRGYWLEIDKKNPRGIYSKENCELSCYFCNNDKSDVFNDEQYGEFVKNRPAFLRILLRNQ